MSAAEGARCRADVNQDPGSFRGYSVECGRPAKGTRIYTDGNTYPVCGIHYRARYNPVVWRSVQ